MIFYLHNQYICICILTKSTRFEKSDLRFHQFGISMVINLKFKINNIKIKKYDVQLSVVYIYTIRVES